MISGEKKQIWLKEFINKVNDLEFNEEPYYDHLRHLLIKEVLNTEQVPDMVFDWEPSKVICSTLKEEVKSLVNIERKK